MSQETSGDYPKRDELQKGESLLSRVIEIRRSSGDMKEAVREIMESNDPQELLEVYHDRALYDILQGVSKG